MGCGLGDCAYRKEKKMSSDRQIREHQKDQRGSKAGLQCTITENEPKNSDVSAGKFAHLAMKKKRGWPSVCFNFPRKL